MVHSEVYLNNYVISIAPFSTPAFTPTPIQKTALFACFRFVIFYPYFQGVSWPHLPLCADAYDRTHSIGVQVGSHIDLSYAVTFWGHTVHALHWASHAAAHLLRVESNFIIALCRRIRGKVSTERFSRDVTESRAVESIGETVIGERKDSAAMENDSFIQRTVDTWYTCYRYTWNTQQMYKFATTSTTSPQQVEVIEQWHRKQSGPQGSMPCRPQPEILNYKHAKKLSSFIQNTML